MARDRGFAFASVRHTTSQGSFRRTEEKWALIVPREGTSASPSGGPLRRSFGHADKVGTPAPSYARSARKSREGTPVHGQDPSAERQCSAVVAEWRRPRSA